VPLLKSPGDLKIIWKKKKGHNAIKTTPKKGVEQEEVGHVRLANAYPGSQPPAPSDPLANETLRHFSPGACFSHRVVYF
jgi:hypothetical protein